MTAPKIPRPLGLPTTVHPAQVIKNIETSDKMDKDRAAKRGKPAIDALRPTDGLPFGPSKGVADVQTKAELADERFKASYRVSDTTPSKVDLRIKDMPGPLLLEVTAIDGYDHNPRLYRNESYEDIEASIKSNGFTDALTVTRRRDGDRYMLAAGSNTTLEILKHLWTTTGDERFRWVNCVYQPYEGDTKLLAQHLGENLNRGNMRFWEVAKGMTELLAMIEKELAPEKPLSVRDQAEVLNQRGLRADKATVTRWNFAVSRLQRLGGSSSRLGIKQVADVIQPRLSALRALAAKFKIADEDYWSKIVDPTLEQYDRDFEASGAEDLDAVTVCDRVEATLAERVEESVASIRQMLSILKLSPELTLADLRMPSPNVAAGNPASQTAALGGGAAAASQQAPLPLGPGVVRDGSKAPAPPAANRTTTITHSGQAGAPAAPEERASQPAAAAALFAASATSDDPLRDLHEVVQQLLAAAQLGDTLRWHDPLPLGFYLELPDPKVHVRRKVELGSPDFHVRTIKTVVWWSLVLMTGQYREGVVPFMDHKSAFYRHFAVDTEVNPLEGTDIDHQPPEADEILMHRITPAPLRDVMRLMREVEERAARVFESVPERWKRMVEIHYASSRT